jgi:hypothetical protein
MIVEKYVPPANPVFLRHCEHGVPLGGRDTDCGEPAVVVLVWDSFNVTGTQTLCVRHALQVGREINAIVVASTEEG